MSILMGVLQEELDRLDRQEVAFRRDLQEVVKGYISKKVINGKEYFYLQRKENGKVISKYIAANELPEVEAQIRRRKLLEEGLRRIKEDRKKLKKILG